jgi:tetratricopeptide (TPR) repeat protein
MIDDFFRLTESQDDFASHGDEFLLIADTYYSRKNFTQAKKFYYVVLTKVRECIVRLDIWLRYGNCCNYLNEIEESINAYRNAVNLDPSNCEAALSLVNILKKNSLLFDEASNVIKNSKLSLYLIDQGISFFLSN